MSWEAAGESPEWRDDAEERDEASGCARVQ